MTFSTNCGIIILENEKGELDMKVSVCAQVTYYYTAEIPDDVTDIVTAADSEDPIYADITHKLHLCPAVTDYDGVIVSVADESTGKLLYED